MNLLDLIDEHPIVAHTSLPGILGFATMTAPEVVVDTPKFTTKCGKPHHSWWGWIARGPKDTIFLHSFLFQLY